MLSTDKTVKEEPVFLYFFKKNNNNNLLLPLLTKSSGFVWKSWKQKARFMKYWQTHAQIWKLYVFLGAPSCAMQVVKQTCGRLADREAGVFACPNASATQSTRD